MATSSVQKKTTKFLLVDSSETQLSVSCCNPTLHTPHEVEELNCAEDNARRGFGGGIKSESSGCSTFLKSFSPLNFKPKNKKQLAKLHTSRCDVNSNGKKPTKINTWRDKPKKKFTRQKTRVNDGDHEVLIEKASREAKMHCDFYHKLHEREMKLLTDKKKDRRRKTKLDINGDDIAKYCARFEIKLDTIFNVGNFLLFVKNIKNIILSGVSKTMMFDLTFTISTYIMSLGYNTADVSKTATHILTLCLSVFQGYDSQAAFVWNMIQNDLSTVSFSQMAVKAIKSPFKAFTEAMKVNFSVSEQFDDFARSTSLENYVKNLSNTVFVKEMIPQFVLSVPLIALSIPFPAAFAFLKSSRAIDFYVAVTRNFDSYKKAIFDFVDNILPHLLDGEFVPSTDPRQMWTEETAMMLDCLTSPLAMHKFVRDKGIIVGDTDRAVRTAMLPLLHRQAIVGNTLLLKKESALSTTISRYLVLLKLAEANTQQMLTTTNYVEQPVVILWYGSAGCGKSELVEKMSRHLTDVLKLAQVPSTTDPDRMMNSMYTVVSTAKYMDGYFGQDIVLFDDLGATRSDTGPLLDIFLKGVGTIPYFPNQAELEFKGKIQWAAKLVHVTSNDKTCYLGSNVYHMPAWNRRMSIQVGITIVEGQQRFSVTTPSRDGTTDVSHGFDLTREEMSRLVYHLAEERRRMSREYTQKILTEDFLCVHERTGTTCKVCYPICHHYKKVKGCKHCLTHHPCGHENSATYCLECFPQNPLSEEEKLDEPFVERAFSNIIPGGPLYETVTEDTTDIWLSFLPSFFWVFEDFWMYGTYLSLSLIWPFSLDILIYFVGFIRFLLELLYQGDFNLFLTPYLFLFQYPVIATCVHLCLNGMVSSLPVYSVMMFLKIHIYGPIYRSLTAEFDKFTIYDRLVLLGYIFFHRWDHMDEMIIVQKHKEKIQKVNKSLTLVAMKFLGFLSPFRWYIALFGSTLPLYYVYKKFVNTTKVVYTQLGMAIPSEVSQKAIQLDYELGVTPMLNSMTNAQTTTYPSYPIQTTPRLRTIDYTNLLDVIKRQTLTIFVNNGLRIGSVFGLISGNTVYTVKHAFDFDSKEIEVVLSSEFVKQWCVTKIIHRSELFDVGNDIIAFVVNVQLGKNLVSHFHMSELNTGDMVTMSSKLSPGPIYKKSISYATSEEIDHHQGRAWAFANYVEEGDSGTPICYVRYENGVIRNMLIVGLVSGYCGGDNFDKRITFFGVFRKIPEIIDKTLAHQGIESYDLGTAKPVDLIDPNPKYAMSGHLPPGVQPICVGSFLSKGSQRSSDIVETKWLTEFPNISKKYCVPFMKSRTENGVFISNQLSALKQMAEVARIKNPRIWVLAAQSVEIHLRSLNPPIFETMNIQQAVSGFDAIPSINMSTSMGFPFKGVKGDHFYGEHGSLLPSKEALDEIEFWQTKLAQGINIVPLVRGSVKDEVTTFKKRNAGEERIFFSGSTIFVILLRMYYGSFMEWLGTTRFRSFTSIGINAMSPEWKRLYDYLTDDGGRLFLDTDYSKFDKRMNILSFAVDMATEFIIKNSKMTDRAKKIMRTLSASIHQYCVDMQGDIYHYATSTPSGVFGTSHFNCLCEAMIEVACFAACYGSYNNFDFEKSLSLVILGDLFFKNIRLCNYGDDNVKSAPIEMTKTFYTAEKIQIFSAALGYDVTSVEKDGTPLRWKTLEECTFLKRSFKPQDDLVFSPLEQLSIEKMICFRDSKSPLSEEDWELAVKKNMLMESLQHGKDYYESIRAVLKFGDSYDVMYPEFVKLFKEGFKYTAHWTTKPTPNIIQPRVINRALVRQEHFVPEPGNLDRDDDAMSIESDRDDHEVTLFEIENEDVLDDFYEMFTEEVNDDADWLHRDDLYCYYRKKLKGVMLYLYRKGKRYIWRDVWDAIGSLLTEFIYQHHPNRWHNFRPITLFEYDILRDYRTYCHFNINPFTNFVPRYGFDGFTELDLTRNATAPLMPYSYLSVSATAAPSVPLQLRSYDEDLSASTAHYTMKTIDRSVDFIEDTITKNLFKNVLVSVVCIFCICLATFITELFLSSCMFEIPPYLYIILVGPLFEEVISHFFPLVGVGIGLIEMALYGWFVQIPAFLVHLLPVFNVKFTLSLLIHVLLNSFVVYLNRNEPSLWIVQCDQGECPAI